MLSELTGASIQGWKKSWFVKRRDEKKKTIQRKTMLLWNWWDAGLWSATCRRILSQGLCPHPCLCHPPSGLSHLPHRPTYPNSPSNSYNRPKTRLFFILPKFSHLALLPLAGFRTLVLLYMAADGSTLPYFQETVQTYMPIHAMRSARYRLLG